MPEDGIERDWDYVEGVIRDLKRDGYEVAEFKSNTSNARPKKAFLLRVERETDTTREVRGNGSDGGDDGR